MTNNENPKVPGPSDSLLASVPDEGILKLDSLSDKSPLEAIDKYQNEEFLDLLDEGVSQEELSEILKLRDIKNRDIFVENQNSFNDNSTFFNSLPACGFTE